MSESAYTPGPWEPSGSRNIIRTKTYANERGGLSGGILVAQFWTTPSEADARLMAAAPELLDALKEANALLLAPAEDLKESVLSRVRAAISKAEPQS